VIPGRNSADSLQRGQLVLWRKSLRPEPGVLPDNHGRNVAREMPVRREI
jgi:hypothetical protein